jgi:hypothetical protein
MLVWSYIQWWYGTGWQQTAGSVRTRIRSIYLNFSVPILLRTLMSPWRRIVSNGGGSLSQRFHAVIDNFVSRWVGLGVRLGALIAALVMIAITAVGGAIILILWPLVPIIGIALIIRGAF